MSDRIDVETTALLALGVWAQRQLVKPKNRAKGTPRETVRELVHLAHGELDEAIDAIERGLGLQCVLAELGDAGAYVGLAMWRAMRGRDV